MDVSFISHSQITEQRSNVHIKGANMKKITLIHLMMTNLRFSHFWVPKMFLEKHSELQHFKK